MSPYLFVICAEGLGALLKQAQDQKLIHGIEIGRNAPPVTHLFFADDSLIFCKANWQDGNKIKQLLLQYERASGQAINYSKSAIFFSNNVPSRVRVNMMAILNIHTVGGHGKYLGLPETIGASKRRVFGYIRDRVDSRLKGWKEKLLSQGGKEILIKSVALALPNYAMSCFKIPATLCREINRSIARYWWGQKEDERRIHWVSWEALTDTKENGGLGFRDLEDFNDAMLAKQAWRLIENPSSLLGRILKARYFRSSSFLDANLGSNPSWGWRSILHGRKVIENNLRWAVGDDKRIRVWDDQWLPNGAKISTPRGVGMEAGIYVVEDLMLADPRRWDAAKIQRYMLPFDAERIQCIPLSLFDCEDRLIWSATKDGEYAVNSGYVEARKLCRSNDSEIRSLGDNSRSLEHKFFFKHIWAIDVPSKIKHFLWKCSREILPVLVMLAKKHVTTDTVCIFCKEEEENLGHLFFKCPFAKVVWYCSSLQVVSSEGPCSSFMEWWMWRWEEWRKDPKCKEIFVQAAYLLWSIWLARNSARFNNHFISPLEASNKALLMAAEFLEVSSCTSSEAVSGASMIGTWIPPAINLLKVNCDGAWDHDSRRGGLGFVIRNHEKNFIARRAIRVNYALSAQHVEALAIRESIMFCIQEGFGRVVIESDAKEIVEDVIKGGKIAETMSIVKDIIYLCNQLEVSSFSFTPRKANYVAHELAAFGRSTGGNVATLFSVPSWLEQAIAHDCRSNP